MSGCDRCQDRVIDRQLPQFASNEILCLRKQIAMRPQDIIADIVLDALFPIPAVEIIRHAADDTISLNTLCHRILREGTDDIQKTHIIQLHDLIDLCHGIPQTSCHIMRPR